MSRETITVRVRNVLGIIKADLTLTGVTVVAGINAAGKSSLLEAVAACALAEPNVRGLRTKASQAQAVHEGAENGSVGIDYDRGKLRLVYPEGTVEQTGRPTFLGSAIGIGRVRFMAIAKPEDRSREFCQRCNAVATLDDLREYLEAHPGSGIEQDTHVLATLWADITQSGWDPIAKRLREYGIKRKGAWEQVTAAKWGDKKAATWLPAGLDPTENYDPDLEGEKLINLRAEIARATVAEAAAKINVAVLESELDEASKAVLAGAGLAEDRASVSAQLDAKQTERRAVVIPEDIQAGHHCPHCQIAILVGKDSAGYTTLTAPPPPVDRKQLALLRTRAMELDHDIRTLSSTAARLAEQDVVVRTKIALVHRLHAKLDEARAAPPPVDAAIIDSKRERALGIERLLALLETRDKATIIFGDWNANDVVLDALEVGGARQVVLERELGRVNKQLGRIAGVAGIRAVVLTPEMDATYDGRPYGLISESEKWRVDFALGVLFHQLEDATFLLLDRLDVIVPQDRGGLVLALHRLKVTALIGLTVKEAQMVPDLAAAKIGAAVWVAGGIVGPLPS